MMTGMSDAVAIAAQTAKLIDTMLQDDEQIRSFLLRLLQRRSLHSSDSTSSSSSWELNLTGTGRLVILHAGRTGSD